MVPAMTNPKRLHPGLRPNPPLPTYIDGNRAARSKVLETWARQWGIADELVLLASSRGEAHNLNLLARSAHVGMTVRSCSSSMPACGERIAP